MGSDYMASLSQLFSSLIWQPREATSPLGALVLSQVKRDGNCAGYNGLRGRSGSRGLPAWGLGAHRGDVSLQVQVPMCAHVTQISHLIDPTTGIPTFDKQNLFMT